jgi:hypothetical protein
MFLLAQHQHTDANNVHLYSLLSLTNNASIQITYNPAQWTMNILCSRMWLHCPLHSTAQLQAIFCHTRTRSWKIKIWRTGATTIELLAHSQQQNMHPQSLFKQPPNPSITRKRYYIIFSYVSPKQQSREFATIELGTRIQTEHISKKHLPAWATC